MRWGGGYRRAFYRRAFSLDRGWGQSGRSGLLPPGGLHQLSDGPTNGPSSVHYFTVQTDGVPRFPHLVTDKNTRSRIWTSRPSRRWFQASPSPPDPLQRDEQTFLTCRKFFCSAMPLAPPPIEDISNIAAMLLTLPTLFVSTGAASTETPRSLARRCWW